jgi:selenium-binding protein 1
VLDAETFELKGRWEDGGEAPPFNYDFWYQPRKNVLLSSEFGEPNAYEPGFDLGDVEAGRYGHRLHFWNLAERKLEQTVDLGESGLLPFEVRWKHDPEAEEGFVGAALSSTLWRFRRDNGGWAADQVVAVEPVELEGWPFPAPGVMSDLVLSMDDFYPGLRSWLLRVNCDPSGGMEVDRTFFVDLHDRPTGAARAHEVRLQGGDCTTEIFQ